MEGTEATNARLLDPKTHDETKRRRVGVAHTNWDNLMTKWSDSQRWWETSKEWDRIVSAAEEICRRTLGYLPTERVRRIRKRMKGRRPQCRKETKLRKWDPSWRKQTRVQTWRDSNLVVNSLKGRWKINSQRFRAEVQKTQNLLDKRYIRPMSDHMGLFEHICRQWNEEAGLLTHEAR